MAAASALGFVSLAKALPTSNLNCSSSSSFVGRKVTCSNLSTSTSCNGPGRIFMMAKREQELEELRKMSDEQLREGVVELKGELVVLRMKQAARQEIKTSEFQRMRKRISRMLTIYRERELEKGIKKRESRKLDRAWKQNITVKPPPSLVAFLEKKEEGS